MTSTTTTTPSGTVFRYVDMTPEQDADHAPRWYDGLGLYLVLMLVAGIVGGLIAAG